MEIALFIILVLVELANRVAYHQAEHRWGVRVEAAEVRFAEERKSLQDRLQAGTLNDYRMLTEEQKPTPESAGPAIDGDGDFNEEDEQLSSGLAFLRNEQTGDMIARAQANMQILGGP